MSVNGYADKLAFNVRSLIVGTAKIRSQVSHILFHLLWNVVVLFIT